jgi:predicted transcriptional regulator
VDATNLITLTADIVASHVSNNRVPPADMPNLIQRVHEALMGVSQPLEQPEEKKTPIVSVRASINPDYLVCMECGRKQKMLRRHLRNAHDMTPEQYRKDYGLPDSYPTVAPNYVEQRRQIAKDHGLGRKGRKGRNDGSKGAKE